MVLRYVACAGLAASWLAGCGVKIGGDPSLAITQDSGGGGGGGGGGGSDGGAIDAMVAIDATPVIPRVVYLNFGPQDLFATIASSDATQNTAEWIQAATGTKVTSPATSRSANDQTTIIDGVTTALQNTATVVTTRPASGQYVMIVYGGKAGNVDSFFGNSTMQLDCGDTAPNDVGWIADAVSDQIAINNTLGAIGFGLGLTSVNKSGDCMCGWGDNCNQNNGTTCSLNNGVTRDTNTQTGPNNEPSLQCAGALPQQDELTTFQTAFATGL